jgi:hypothetical protein
MFSGKSAIDLKNLDAESLSTIKSHYNLFESGSTEPEQLKKKPASFTDKQWYDYILGTKADPPHCQGSYTQCYGSGDRHTTIFRPKHTLPTAMTVSINNVLLKNCFSKLIL